MGGDITGERFCYHNSIASTHALGGVGLSTRLLQQLVEVACSSLTSADPSGFITFWREISLHAPITLQKAQSVVATPESLAYFCMMIQHFFGA